MLLREYPMSQRFAITIPRLKKEHVDVFHKLLHDPASTLDSLYAWSKEHGYKFSRSAILTYRMRRQGSVNPMAGPLRDG